MNQQLTLHPSKIALWLFAVATALFAVFVVSVALIEGYGASSEGVMGLINLNKEASIPTWFSQALLLAVAAVLFVIALRTENYKKHWGILGAIFLYISIDEGASIHELTVTPIRNLFDLNSGFFYYSWVLLFGALGIIIGLLYLKFLARLPRRTRLLCITAATLFVGGGIGMEMIGGRIAAVAGESGTNFALAVATEEYLEMSGAILFLYALLDYMKQKLPELSFYLK